MANRQERRTRKYKLGEFRKQAIEATGQLSSIELEGDNAETFEVPHPLLVDDETQKRIELFQSGDELDKDEDGRIKEPHRIGDKLADPAVIRSARAILGDEEYARFTAAGGHANDITLAWQELVRNTKDRIEEDPN